jgi:hypothetical protein
MEDGIDRNCYFHNDIKEIKPESYLYVCIPRERCLNELKITFDRYKAINFLKEKTYRIEIYKKNEENLYVPSFDCLYINN